MVFLLWLLSFIAVAGGLFGLGLGVPIRETWFGASLLTAGSVAITGGFVLVGLAAAVRELRRIAQGFKAPPSEMPRPVPPLARRDGRLDGADKWTESRPATAVVLRTGAPDVIRQKHDPAEVRERSYKSRSEAWLRHLQDEIESALRQADTVSRPIDDHHAGEGPQPPNSWPHPAIPLPPDPSDTPTPGTPPAPPDDQSDAVLSSQRRNPAEGPERRTEASPEIRPHPADSKSPPLAVDQPAAWASTRPSPVETPPLPIVRAGVIQQTSYTLFADGSIETQMPDGVLRFSSVEEFLGHLEKGEG